MKFIKGLNLFVIALMLVALFPPAKPALAQTATPGGDITRDVPYVPGEVVVAFDEALTAAQFKSSAAALAGEVSAQVVDQFANTALLSFDPAADVPALVEQLNDAEGVRYAEPNYISWIPETQVSATNAKLQTVTRTDDTGHEIEISVTDMLAMRTRKVVNGRAQLTATYPNDIFNNWGNEWIKEDIVWPTTNASPMVCVVDSGVDINHPDLLLKAVNGYDYVNNDSTANDDNGHGTHVAGTIAAKVGNGSGGIAGISNGKVLAVKVMTAQGWGTNLDIAQGVRYCANNTYVKVINMSLGGVPSRVEYDALNYAINTKKKLVVAAAGNESESWISGTNELGQLVYNNVFPAAWADVDTPVYTLEDEYEMTGQNNIAAGLISVGAARSPWSGVDERGYVWVDTDNSGIKELDDEGYPLEAYQDCAADFSNYGSWVELVAPGEDIYSTTPTSYPFWNNYFDYWSSKNQTLGGTSMATPHVAGAAARLWSIHSTWTAAQIANTLLDSGDPLNLYVDPAVTAGDDLTVGYAAETYQGEAPFCWPVAEGNFTLEEDMSASRYLNLARAMNRMGITAGAVNAATGLPLVGAQIQVVTQPGTVVRGTAQLTSNYSRWTDLINLPYIETKPVAGSNPPQYNSYYSLKVNKTSLTYGYQTYSSFFVNPESDPVKKLSMDGQYIWSETFVVGVPASMSNITVVANWLSGYDLDLYVWLPSDIDTDGPTGPDRDNSAVVGAGNSGSDYDMGVGALYQFPRARWFRDGGYDDWMPVESVAIAKNPSGPYPYYTDTNGDSYLDAYEILLTDYNDGSDSYSSLEQAMPVLRVWYAGKLQSMWDMNSLDYIGTDVRYPDCDGTGGWWSPIILYRQGTRFWVDAYPNPSGECSNYMGPYTEGAVKFRPEKMSHPSR